MVGRGARDGKGVGERTPPEVQPVYFRASLSYHDSPLPFCTAVILYYKLALFRDPGQRKHARKTQNHTHTHTQRWDAFFPPSSLRGASSAYTAASGAAGLGRKACTEPLPLDCEYCTNPTLETDTHTRGAATGVGHGHAPTRTRPRTGGGGGAPPSRVAVRGILCLFKSLYVHADNPESLCTNYQILIKDAF